MRFVSHAMLFLLCGVAFAARAVAQDLEIPEAVYPSLPRQAPSAEAFVPSGWTLESKVTGDLNRDGIADIALVLHQQNPKNVVPNQSLGENPFDTNPRMLAVAFGERKGAGYTLKLENHTLIPRRVEPILEDPFDADGMAIGRGTLRIRLGFFASAGSWMTSQTTYRFHYQGNRFELIGYDRTEAERNTGKTTDTSINYLAGKRSVSIGTIESDAKQTRWSRLPRRPLLALEDIGDGVEFEPKN